MEKTAHRKDLCFILNSRKWNNLMKNLLKKLCPLKKVDLKYPAFATQTAVISNKQGILWEGLYEGAQFQAFRSKKCHGELILPSHLKTDSIVWNNMNKCWQAKLRSDTCISMGLIGCISPEPPIQPLRSHSQHFPWFFSQFFSQNTLRKVINE